MYNFSAFIDDGVASSLEVKIEICSRLMINNMEIYDNIGGDCIADFSGERIENLRNLLIGSNKKIVLLNCTKPASELDYYKRMFKNGCLLGIENVRLLFGNENIPEEASMEGFKAVCRIGEAYGIRILIENNSHSFLSNDNALTQVFRNIGSQNTGLIFNPMEYAKMKSHPFFHMFYNSRLKNRIGFLRINDGLFTDGAPTLPGQGNAEIKELASIILARGFKGYFSLYPYFKNMDFETYKEVIESFKKILMEI